MEDSLALVQTSEKLFQKAVQLMVERWKPERALVFHGYDKDDMMVPRAAHGLDPASVYTAGDISLGILQEVIDAGQPKMLVDAMQDPRFGDRTSTLLSGIRSVMACPLMDEAGNPIGILYADSRVQVAAFKKVYLAWM